MGARFRFMLFALAMGVLNKELGAGGANVIQSVPKAKPDFSIYHTHQGLMAEVKRLVSSRPEVMKMEEFSHSNGNYSATVEVVSVDLAGVDKPSKGKLRVLLDFGEHAREFISPEVGLRLLAVLADEIELRALLLASGYWDDFQIHQLLHLLHCCVSFKILPMENHGGREVVDKGDLCERKNGEKVDPNRNWAVDWGKKEKDYDPYEEYPGTHAFSEPEAVLVRNVAHDFLPHLWVNVHSGMSGLFMPYDHIAKVADGPANNYTLSMLHALNDVAFNGTCVVGSGGASVGYLAHGTATDYMMDVLHVAAPLTWEIYGDLEALYTDCFRMFNPLTHNKFDEILQKWTTAVFDTVLLMVGHPAESVAALNLRASSYGVSGGSNAAPDVDPATILESFRGRLHSRGAGVVPVRSVEPKLADAVRGGVGGKIGKKTGRPVRPWSTAQGRSWSDLSHTFEGSQLVHAAYGVVFAAGACIVWATSRRLLGPARRKRRSLVLSHGE